MRDCKNFLYLPYDRRMLRVKLFESYKRESHKSEMKPNDLQPNKVLICRYYLEAPMEVLHAAWKSL